MMSKFEAHLRTLALLISQFVIVGGSSYLFQALIQFTWTPNSTSVLMMILICYLFIDYKMIYRDFISGR